jgi:hypothetical protein
VWDRPILAWGGGQPKPQRDDDDETDYRRTNTPTYLDYAVQHNHVDHRPLAPFSQTFGQPGRRYHLVSALGIVRGLGSSLHLQ